MTHSASQRLTRLPNGIMVATDAMPDIASVYMGVYVGAGARAETPEEHGIAHLLEHMAFKGTTTRSAQDIAEHIEAVGGDINAGTSMEQTAYYARVLKEDTALGVDILSDILTNSVFDPDELRREQAVIVQEIGAAQDTPDDLVFEMMQEAAFAGQPIGRSILGTPQTVCGFARDDVKGFLDRHYRGERLVVAAAGAVDHDAFVAEVGTRLGGLAPDAAPPVLPCVFTGGERRVERDLEQVNIALALPGVSSRDSDVHVAQILANIMGGGMSSRLFQEAREKRGLCYTVSSFHWAYSDTGIFGVHAACAKEDADDLVRLVIAEIRRVATDLTMAELAKAKAQMRAGLLMGLESSGARLERIARSLQVHGRLRGTTEMAGKIAAIELDAVRAYAAGLAEAPQQALALIGPVSGIASLADLAKTA